MAASPRPPSTAPPPLVGELRDVGGTRREAIRAQSYTALGAVKCLGDLEAGVVELHGLASIGGRVAAERLRAEGTLDVARDVVVRSEATLRGRATIGTSLAAGDLAVRGRLTVRGPMTLDGEGRITGTLEVEGPLVARSLQFDGTLLVPGTIDCPMFTGRLRHRSRVGTLRSENVRLVRPSWPFGSTGHLVIDRIEAADVELDGVDCEYLRAERIRLGAGTHVTRLDGHVVRRHPTAVVGPRSWEPLPRGLAR